ncbi:MAG: hypothetical protein IPL35_13370 [Sphingobacteriales bacterium]|nr:hypothetical protein [Sphingobacteriales bacterium]
MAAWAMFTNLEANLWLRGAEYVKEAVEFYSEKVGEYPYSHATAVQSALSAGAGMEYPMITVIGKSGSAMSLERVIVHEVGHNWFYGLLGSNEREHAWMDEGMNSYYENRYFDEKYSDKENMAGTLNMGNLGKILKTPDHLKMRDIHEIGNNIKLYKNEAQAIDLHAANYDPTNYGLVVYMKTALIFKTLEKNIGTKKFDAMMHHYYDVWHFGHPYPEDLRAIFENDSKKNLDWFFDEHIKTTEPVDYAFKKVKREAKSIGKDTFDEITLLNKAHHVAAPFSISAVKDGKIELLCLTMVFYGEMRYCFLRAITTNIPLMLRIHSPKANAATTIIVWAHFFRAWSL